MTGHTTEIKTGVATKDPIKRYSVSSGKKIDKSRQNIRENQAKNATNWVKLSPNKEESKPRSETSFQSVVQSATEEKKRNKVIKL